MSTEKEPVRSCCNCECLPNCNMYTVMAKAVGVIIKSIFNTRVDGWSEKHLDELHAKFVWMNEEIGKKCQYWRIKE